MDSLYLNALLVSIVFFTLKIIEERFNKDETVKKPLKLIVKDTLIVYICCIIGDMIYKQFFPEGIMENTANAFVNKPDF